MTTAQHDHTAQERGGEEKATVIEWVQGDPNHVRAWIIDAVAALAAAAQKHGITLIGGVTALGVHEGRRSHD